MACMDSAVDESVDPGGPPVRCHLTEEELDAAAVARFEQRAEQGFGKIPSFVLCRIARIVASVPLEMGTTAAPAYPHNHDVLGRAASTLRLWPLRSRPLPMFTTPLANARRLVCQGWSNP